MRKKRTFRLKVDRDYTMDDTYICLFLNGICSSRCTFNEDGDICEGDLDDRPRWCHTRLRDAISTLKECEK